jgi:hypothetical protein
MTLSDVLIEEANIFFTISSLILGLEPWLKYHFKALIAYHLMNVQFRPYIAPCASMMDDKVHDLVMIARMSSKLC